MDFVKLCMDMGAFRAEEIPVDELVLQPELRALCEQNACGRYAGCYTCPPYVGEVEALISKLKSFSRAVIWQNVYALEDSFDFEGMMEAQSAHNTMTLQIARRARAARENLLVLAAGGCVLCGVCALRTGEPCRHGDDALSSLEAYGINVSETSERTSMKYINGENTVTYFSGLFY